MLEDKNENVPIKQDNNVQGMLEKVKTDENDIVKDIVNSESRQELESYVEQFNISQTKHNALRTIKLNNLLSKLEDQAIERIEKKPDQVSNKELFDFMNVVSGQIDRSNKYVSNIQTEESIKYKNNITAQKTDININVGPQLSKESKERVTDLVSSILSKLEKIPAKSEENVIEVVEEESEKEGEDSIEIREYSGTDRRDQAEEQQ